MNQTSRDENPKESPQWLQVVESELEALYQLPGVVHAVLAGGDGNPLAIVPEGSTVERHLAATLAALHGTSQLAVHQANGGVFSEALVRSEQVEILCVPVGEDVVLGIVAERGALTGLLFIAIESAANKILRVIDRA